MILTLKQGIGRLIRSKDDVGNVYILDKRFKKSGYSTLILKEFSKYSIKDYIPNKMISSQKKSSRPPINKGKSLF
jgi:Rad3-related DNA helicase